MLVRKFFLRWAAFYAIAFVLACLIPVQIHRRAFDKAFITWLHDRIISNAPVGVKYSIEAVNRGLDTSLAEGFLLEASLFAICAGTDDKKEGTSAFLAKRAPKFQGR
jgi:enoyl-CoA hydratase/carnithine racemase